MGARRGHTTRGKSEKLLLESKTRDPTGGPDASPKVQPMWDAHASGEVVEAQTDG